MQLRVAVDGRVLDDKYHGIGRITEALLAGLGNYPDIEVVVFLRPGQTSSRFDVDALISQGGFERASFDLPLTSPMQWLRWPSALSAVRADVALFPYHLGAAVSGRARRYSVVHDCIIEADRAFSPDARTRLLYRLLTAVVVRRTQVLAPSRASAHEISRYYHLRMADWQVLPWGIDPGFAAGASRLSSVGGLEIPSEYFLHVGARRPHKNVTVAVAALSELKPDEHLVLVGSPDPRFPDKVPSVARELGVADRVIELSGLSEAELYGLYAGAKAFVYPSLVEGFGLPLLEAMAAGVPVVASDIPVFREVGGDAAIFVAADKPTDWARALRSLDDPALRADLISAGRRQAERARWDDATAALVAALRRP
jgi:glycosyltransferase involved in cell wall biosynthesis